MPRHPFFVVKNRYTVVFDPCLLYQIRKKTYIRIIKIKSPVICCNVFVLLATYWPQLLTLFNLNEKNYFIPHHVAYGAAGKG